MKPYPIRLPSGYVLNMELFVYSEPTGPGALRLVFAAMSAGPGVPKPLELTITGADAEAFERKVDQIIAAQGPVESN